VTISLNNWAFDWPSRATLYSLFWSIASHFIWSRN